MMVWRTIGVVLIVVGVAALIYRGITYTTNDALLKVGPVEVAKEDREYLPLPPILGGLAIVGGATILFSAWRRSRGARH